MPREGSRVSGALSGDGAGHLVTAPVRKERLSRSKKELAEEAAKVLHQVDTLDCVTTDHGECGLLILYTCTNLLFQYNPEYV